MTVRHSFQFTFDRAFIHAALRKSANRVFGLWIHMSPEGFIRYELDDDGFCVHSGSGHSRFEWKGLRRLWRYEDAWLIEIVKMQSVFFPPGQVSEEAKEFIVERCREASVRV